METDRARDDGREIYLGAHLVTPIYLAAVQRAGRGPILRVVNPGGGLLARFGYELPLGFSVELQTGIAFHYVDYPAGALRRSLMRVDARVAGRYAFHNESPVLPFVELGAGVRMLWLDWEDGESVAAAPGLLLDAVVGTQIAITPYFALEGGLAVDYVPALATLNEPGLVGLAPFLGATLYFYDERGY